MPLEGEGPGVSGFREDGMPSNQHSQNLPAQLPLAIQVATNWKTGLLELAASGYTRARQRLRHAWNVCREWKILRSQVEYRKHAAPTSQTRGSVIVMSKARVTTPSDHDPD